MSKDSKIVFNTIGVAALVMGPLVAVFALLNPAVFSPMIPEAVLFAAFALEVMGALTFFSEYLYTDWVLSKARKEHASDLYKVATLLLNIGTVAAILKSVATDPNNPGKRHKFWLVFILISLVIVRLRSFGENGAANLVRVVIWNQAATDAIASAESSDKQNALSAWQELETTAGKLLGKNVTLNEFPEELRTLIMNSGLSQVLISGVGLDQEVK